MTWTKEFELMGEQSSSKGFSFPMRQTTSIWEEALYKTVSLQHSVTSKCHAWIEAEVDEESVPGANL